MRHSVHIGLNQPSHLCDSLERRQSFYAVHAETWKFKALRARVYSVLYP